MELSHFQIGKTFDQLTLESIGTASEIAAILRRKDGRRISRSTVRLWMKGDIPIPTWAKLQLGAALARQHKNSILTMGIPYFWPGLSSKDHPGYWRAFRRDSRPLFGITTRAFVDRPPPDL